MTGPEMTAIATAVLALITVVVQWILKDRATQKIQEYESLQLRIEAVWKRLDAVEAENTSLVAENVTMREQIGVLRLETERARRDVKEAQEEALRQKARADNLERKVADLQYEVESYKNTRGN